MARPRRQAVAAALALVLLAAGMPSAVAQRVEASAWAAVRGPSLGPTRIIGGTGLGCIGGAVALPMEGPGWQAVRVSRNRHWGHPSLVAFLRDFAGRARAQGFNTLWIGDMSQPRGGPMPWGHASHQAGLDADIWLDLSAKPEVPAAARETIPETSLVLPDETGVDRRFWRPQHGALIRLAAESPGVDRVLVNHAIKRELCRTDRGAAWLHRVRPWRGHDSHMHVRLRCPLDQPDCRGLPPPPAGDGCDASLDWWLSPEARHPPPRPPGPPPRLPEACAAVLEAR